MPGFVSGHDHLVGAGWLLAGVKLTDAKDQDELLKLIKDYAVEMSKQYDDEST